MNVQRLIEKYKKLEGVWDAEGAELARQIFLQDLEQLDGPEPVKIPPSVAVWYEINKDNLDKNIAYLCLNNWGEFINDKTLFNWMSNTDNFIQILVNMHQFGYEVEEEKRYLVRIKGVEEDNAFLNYYAPRNEWFMDSSCDMKDIRTFHTRKELEEVGFGWVFDCEGIEIKEVE
jgi:gp178|nr:MAG TPA: Protein of unknown function (DUF1642) [Caudoviricetes sp.]